VVGISFLVLSHFSGPEVVILETGNAIYQGLESKSGTVAVFYGVPYAEPPLGDLRFRAPVPLTPFYGEESERPIINARDKPDFCIQGPGNPGEQCFSPQRHFKSDKANGTSVGERPNGAGSEDCLHLNVYTPKSVLASVGAEKLPVLVYIHGGGFEYGNPLSWPFEHWIEQFPNTVIVSIYYRLSIFGFLSAPSKLKNTGLDFNAGFRDQLLALKWVKQVLWPICTR
jgi:carboxylesterase type B